jgi:hypothetical protein
MGVPVHYLNLPSIDEPTEYEIQHLAQTKLEAAGYVVRGEIPYHNKAGGINCRFDLMVFDPEYRELLCIIECKREEEDVDLGQLSRYQVQVKVPVVPLVGVAGALDAVRIVEAALEKPLGRLLASDISAAKKGMYRSPNYKRPKQ